MQSVLNSIQSHQIGSRILNSLHLLLVPTSLASLSLVPTWVVSTGCCFFLGGSQPSHSLVVFWFSAGLAMVFISPTSFPAFRHNISDPIWLPTHEADEVCDFRSAGGHEGPQLS